MNPQPPHRRPSSAVGFTLIELLAAIAVLGAVTVAVSSMSVATSRLGESVGERVPWEIAANRIIAMIDRDLATGDLALPDRAQVHSGYLIIKTRSGNPDNNLSAVAVEHRYELDGENLNLTRTPLDPSGVAEPAPQGSSRLLITEVDQWSVAIEERDEDRELVVELIGPIGISVNRRWRLQ